MSDASIDPRLQQYAAASLPPRALAQQPFQSPPQPAQSQPAPASQPYYLAPAHHHHAQPQHAAPPMLAPNPAAALDPALADDSPADHHGSPDDDDDELDHDTSPAALAAIAAGKSPADFKRPRACDSCRGLKVRCDQERPDVSCRRCAKANRPCITTPPTRKRQKKADSRVAELERKIDALTATLHAQKGGAPDLAHLAGAMPQQQPALPQIPQSDGAYRFGSIGHEWQNRYPEPPPGYGPAQSIQPPEPKRRKLGDGDRHATIPEDMDAIHRDLAEHPEMKRGNRKGVQADHSYINTLIDRLMTPETAERIFIRYVNDVFPHFPAIPLPPSTTAGELREKKPLLFLAILAGSSHGATEQLVPQHVQRDLTQLLKDQFADIIWRNGEKSLEIVQALQLSSLWYRPPLHYEQHNFYMMVNCAAIMALDLGLGRKATANVMKLGHNPFHRCHPNASSLEARRTFIVCYYLCMSITMVLRRPILLRWTKYLEESVKILETSPEALPTDKMLCQHVKLAHIAENISVQFCMDDPSAEVAISDPKVIYALKIFENELQQLREENARLPEVEPALKLGEHVTNLYIHEIALHLNQSPADFQPPFPPDAFTSGVGSKDTIGPAHISALSECLTATHGIFDTILSVPLDILLTLPVIFCVRAVYAIVCLMKMWVSVTSSSDVSNIIKKEELKIEMYTEQLVLMFNAIVTRDAQSPHGKFYFVAKRLQERFAQIKEGSVKNGGSDGDSSLRQSDKSARPRSPQSSTNQTPLHLLSEVAMGSSSTSTQAQAQAALQAHTTQQQQQQQAAAQGWYDNSGMPPPLDAMGMPSNGLDPNFDFTQFDLNMGSDADLSALFIPDGMIWYPAVPTYGGNQY